MQEHTKFETVSGMEGDNSLQLALIALSDDNFLIIMLYKFLLRSLFFSFFALLFSFPQFLLSFPFFPFLFGVSRGGDTPLAPHGSATALIHYTIRLAYMDPK